MISVYQLVDALPTALFGMFALWAAGSRRHWFLRTCVVSGVILLPLLIPAYEPVIEFGVDAVLVAGGLAWWRHRRGRTSNCEGKGQGDARLQPRASLKNILLLVAVFAVVTAVLGQHPELSIDQWVEFVGNGCITAVVALVALWIVYGRVRPWRRLAIFVLAIPLLTAILCVQQVGRTVFFTWLRNSTALGNFWTEAWQKWIWACTYHWAVVATIGLSVICAWLYLMRVAHWFDPFRESDVEESPTTPTRTMRRARWTVCILFVAVAAFPLWLFYKLLTPAPLPVVVLPVPNGYDDFIAAGTMIRDSDNGQLGQILQLPQLLIQQELDKHQAAFARIRLGLSRECRFPFSLRTLPADDAIALDELTMGLLVQAYFDGQFGDVDEKVRDNVELLRLASLAEQCSMLNTYNDRGEQGAARALWNLRLALPAKKTRELLKQLEEIGDLRLPWEEVDRRLHIDDENSGWEPHLRSILSDLSGAEIFPTERSRYVINALFFRFLLAELAIRAHLLETGRLPETLDELVPAYLPKVPADPYGAGPLKYRRTADGYILYSVGSNGRDDRGRASPMASKSNDAALDDDESAANLFPVPSNSSSSSSNGDSDETKSPDDSAASGD